MLKLTCEPFQSINQSIPSDAMSFFIIIHAIKLIVPNEWNVDIGQPLGPRMP